MVKYARKKEKSCKTKKKRKMKKIKLEGKLSLNKETVTRLNDSQMQSVNGGFLSWFWCDSDNCGTATCPTQVNCPPVSVYDTCHCPSRFCQSNDVRRPICPNQD